LPGISGKKKSILEQGKRGGSKPLRRRSRGKSRFPRRNEKKDEVVLNHYEREAFEKGIAWTTNAKYLRT